MSAIQFCVDTDLIDPAKMEVKVVYKSPEEEKAGQLVSQFRTVSVQVDQEMEFWKVFAQHWSNDMGGKVVLSENDKIQVNKFLSETFGWTWGIPECEYRLHTTAALSCMK